MEISDIQLHSKVDLSEWRRYKFIKGAPFPKKLAAIIKKNGNRIWEHATLYYRNCVFYKGNPNTTNDWLFVTNGGQFYKKGTFFCIWETRTWLPEPVDGYIELNGKKSLWLDPKDGLTNQKRLYLGCEKLPFHRLEEKLGRSYFGAPHLNIPEISINYDTLMEYVTKSDILKEIDVRIAANTGSELKDNIYIEGDVERLKFLKIDTIEKLNICLIENKYQTILFAEKWIGKDRNEVYDRGIGLFYLEYLLVGIINDPAVSVEYVNKFIATICPANKYVDRHIIPTYNSIKESEEVNTEEDEQQIRLEQHEFDF